MGVTIRQVFVFAELIDDNAWQWRQARLELFDDCIDKDEQLAAEACKLFLARVSKRASFDDDTRVKFESFKTSMGVVGEEEIEVSPKADMTALQMVRFAELVEEESSSWKQARLEIFDKCMDEDEQLAEQAYKKFLAKL